MVCFLSSVNIARLSPVVRAGLHLETKGCDVSPKGTAIPSLLSLQPRRAERQRALQDGTQYHQRQYLVRVRPSQNPSGGRWCCRGRRRHCHDIASGINCSTSRATFATAARSCFYGLHAHASKAKQKKWYMLLVSCDISTHEMSMRHPPLGARWFGQPAVVNVE